jgi:hypothetical protein
VKEQDAKKNIVIVIMSKPERNVLVNFWRAVSNPTTTTINTLKNIRQRLKESGRNTNGSFNKKLQNTIKLLENPYQTTKNRSLSVLQNNRAQRPSRVNVPANLNKINKLTLYLKNVDPSRIKVNYSDQFNENLNQNTRIIKTKYIINGQNAGSAMFVVLRRNGDVYFSEGHTNKDFRGRGVGTALRALMTKAALKSGYKKVIHGGVNKENRSKFRPGGNKNIATSTWIVTKRLGFTPTPGMNSQSVFTKNDNQSKINNVLRKSGLTI